MKSISQYKEGTVATVGFFDGVHAGHRFLMNELNTIARSKNLSSLVVTFSMHPRKVLHSDSEFNLLTTLPEKLVQLRQTKIDFIEVLDFTPELARLTALDFLKSVLKDCFNVKVLLVGHDHRFGYNRTDGFEEYKRFGEMLDIEVIQAERFKTPENNTISSSEIRLAIQYGDIELANKLLTYPYSFEGKVINGFKVGRKIGFPTANLAPVDEYKLLPSFGVYAVKIHIDAEIFSGMMNIGTRPTLSNELATSIEVHIFQFDNDIYGRIITVEFLKKMRNEKKFSSVEELVQQLQKDKERCLEFVTDIKELN